MGGILQVDTIQNNNTSNLITQTNVTTITIGTSGQTISLAGGASSSGFGATYNSGLNWTSTLVTSSLTVSAGVGYFVNTSTAAITLTLPSTPTFGSIVGINDYSGYASTNNITVNPNGNKLEGGTSNKLISTNKESVILNYVDSTRGWLPTSGVNNGTDALISPTYSIDFLVIAGGGAGGVGDLNNGGGGGGAGGYRTSTQTVDQGTVITVTVGDGGTAPSAGSNTIGGNGSNSSISGSGITTITSAGGGGGSQGYAGIAPLGGQNGGSGGGGGGYNNGVYLGGSGNTPSTSPSQGNNGGNGANSGSTNTTRNGGGGGGAGAVGDTGNTSNAGSGGNGTASSITGSSVTYAGGGGGSGSGSSGTPSGSGGSGGGGGGTYSGTAGSGTVNLGGGGGGAGSGDPGAGGKGVVILSMLTTKYSGTTTGSPTVTTSGSNTILKFTGSGSYTA